MDAKNLKEKEITFHVPAAERILVMQTILMSSLYWSAVYIIEVNKGQTLKL